jgi:hypothetical protein
MKEISHKQPNKDIHKRLRSLLMSLTKCCFAVDSRLWKTEVLPHFGFHVSRSKLESSIVVLIVNS